MKPSKKESLRAILLLAAIPLFVMVVVPVVTQLAMGWMIDNTQKELKAKLNNAVINEDYAGWKSAEISDWFGFMVPGDWEIREEDDVLHVLSEGTEIAFGAKIGSDDVAFADPADLLKAMTDLKNAEVKMETIAGFASISDSTFVQMTAVDGEKTEKYYCMLLITQSVNVKSDLCLLFPADDVSDIDGLLESARAIVFGYAFQIEK